jgi:hypothetical protein
MVLGEDKNKKQFYEEEDKEDKESVVNKITENHTRTSTLQKLHSRLVTDAPLDDGSHIGLYNDINFATHAVKVLNQDIKKPSFIKLFTKIRDLEAKEEPDNSIVINFLCFCKFLPIEHSYLYYREN